MTTAERNRLIKKVLSQKFGTGKVRVRGSRGTGYGWVTVKIAYAPKDRTERDELRADIWKIFGENKIEIGTYGYDDPGSDYGFGSTMHINFDPCRERADSYGDQAWRHHLSAADWDRLVANEAAEGHANG